jgi:hypothetical protein
MTDRFITVLAFAVALVCVACRSCRMGFGGCGGGTRLWIISV